MEIEISGYKVQIDEEDWERVSKYTWHVNRPYLRRIGACYFITRHTVDGKRPTLQLHRFICGCSIHDGTHVDHINHNTLDNRKCNLRVCTPKENKWNQYCRKDSLSGYKGVSYIKGKGNYLVRIVYKGKRVRLGLYDDPVEAAKVYDKYALQYYGEFAYTNFPKENYIKEQLNGKTDKKAT